LIYFGLTISTASLFSLALLVAVCVFYNYIADYEERLLEAKFSEEYMDYRKVTGKWLPRICRRV
jgi:protein-S-isoprenylcysteine O-methyltransferase Ste14